MTTIHVIYRSVAGDNAKGRPPGFSKATALGSMHTALVFVPDEFRVVLHYLNDHARGPLDDDIVEWQSRTGRVVDYLAGSARRSYRYALRYARDIDAADDDLIWLAEDDYYYKINAFLVLVRLWADAPRSCYSLYSPVEMISTTSTFGIAHRVLRRRYRTLSLMPFTGGAWDRSTFSALAWRIPFGLHGYQERIAGQGRKGFARGCLRILANMAVWVGSLAARQPVTLVAGHHASIWHQELSESNGIPCPDDWAAYSRALSASPKGRISS
jgi:hypothetical protein